MAAFGVENLLLALYVELFVANQMHAEDNGTDGELEDMRADALSALAGNQIATGTPDASYAGSIENS